MRIHPAAALLAALALDANAATQIVRCTAPGGGVTYQQAPCPDRTDESDPRIPTQFPAPNAAERERLFEREAALHQRLHHRGERETGEEARHQRRMALDQLALVPPAEADPANTGGGIHSPSPRSSPGRRGWLQTPCACRSAW